MQAMAIGLQALDLVDHHAGAAQMFDLRPGDASAIVHVSHAGTGGESQPA
jgi:hypothetical protein